MPLTRRTIAVLGVLLTVAACAHTRSSAVAGAAAPSVPRLEHVVVIVFENKERRSVVGNADAPTFNRYAKQYASLNDYNAVSHPSLPNYLALVSGSTHGIRSDCTDCGPWQHSLGGLLTHAGRSWGGYAQGYPNSPGFVKRHMPFLYFADGVGHVHPLSALDPRHLPAFAFVAPNLCNDSHDCPLSTADGFLKRWLPAYLHVPRTAVFVLFDEGTTSTEGGGDVAAFVAGTAVKRHVVAPQAVDHYTVLRTIEDSFGLPALGASGARKPLTSIWRSTG